MTSSVAASLAATTLSRSALLTASLGVAFALARPATTLKDDVQPVAVQMEFDQAECWRKDAFERKVRARMDTAAAITLPYLPTLAVFPEDVGWVLVVQGMEGRQPGGYPTVAAAGAAVKANLVPHPDWVE